VSLTSHLSHVSTDVIDYYGDIVINRELFASWKHGSDCHVSCMCVTCRLWSVTTLVDI